jgi:hypothetical protein
MKFDMCNVIKIVDAHFQKFFFVIFHYANDLPAVNKKLKAKLGLPNDYSNKKLAQVLVILRQVKSTAFVGTFLEMFIKLEGFIKQRQLQWVYQKVLCKVC